MSRSARRRRGVLRLLYAAPVLVLLLTGVVAVGREWADRAELSAWYARGAAAAAAGRPDEALAAYAAAAGYRDAAARSAAAAAALVPYRDAYLDGLAALDAGRFDDAVAALLPVARDLPGYEDAAARLADARRLRADALRREADAAEGRRDWAAAERALTALAVADPGDPEVGPRLDALRREHAPLVLGRDGDLWLAGPDGGDARLLTDAVPVAWPTWSPDRGRIAFLSREPDDPTSNVALYVIGADGSGLTRLADGLSSHTSPVWSPDGTRLAYTSFAAYDFTREAGVIGVRMVEVATGRETDLSGPTLPLAINPSWSPAGDRVAFVSKDRAAGERPANAPGDVQIVAVATGAVTNLTAGRIKDAWSVAWSPVDDRLLILSLRGDSWYEPPQTAIRLLDALGGEPELLGTGTHNASAPVWSPDGSRFAYVAGESAVRLYDGSGDEERIAVEADLSGFLAWSPDGGALLAAANSPPQPSALITFENGAGTEQSIALDFDLDSPSFGPPQWAPANPLPLPGPPSVAGTGLDPT